MPSLACSVVRIAVFAPQGCSLLNYAMISTPFLQANQILSQHKYQVTLIGAMVEGVPNQTEVKTAIECDDALLANLNHYDLLIVIAEQPPVQSIPMAIKKALQRYYQQQTGQLIAVQAGLWWLFDSAIGRDQEAVVHWSTMDDFKDSFPNVALSQELYHSDTRISSCAGQLAILDHLLNYLKQLEKNSLVDQIRDHLCMDRVRNGNERQRLPCQSLGGEDLQPKLTMAIDLMESNIEVPLTTEQIADNVCISRRQLERLFKNHLNTMPARHYLQLRLKRAQHLLQTSSQSIVQIGLSCGFSSGPHFSSAYKSFYQSTPRQERAKFIVLK
ncbi:MAG: helix-turn-helix domain-containing protein [Psychromonas sp.]